MRKEGGKGVGGGGGGELREVISLNIKGVFTKGGRGGGKEEVGEAME